jgi:hypothetical protein
MDASFAFTVLGTLAMPRRVVLEIRAIMQLPMLAVLAAVAAQAGETRTVERSALSPGGVALLARYEDARLGQVAGPVRLEPNPLQGAIEGASFRSETPDVLELFSRAGLPGSTLRSFLLDDDLSRLRELATSTSSPTTLAALRDERAPAFVLRKDGFEFSLLNTRPSVAAPFSGRADGHCRGRSDASFRSSSDPITSGGCALDLPPPLPVVVRPGIGAVWAASATLSKSRVERRMVLTVSGCCRRNVRSDQMMATFPWEEDS